MTHRRENLTIKFIRKGLNPFSRGAILVFLETGTRSKKRAVRDGRIIGETRARAMKSGEAPYRRCREFRARPAAWRVGSYETLRQQFYFSELKEFRDAFSRSPARR